MRAVKGICADCGKEGLLVVCLTCEKPPKDCTCDTHISFRQKKPKHICGKCYDRRIQRNPKTLISRIRENM